MNCHRPTAVAASFACGAILAAYALDGPAPEAAIAGQAVYGLGRIINGAVAVFGPMGAATVFMTMGGIMAVVSVLLCPSSRRGRQRLSRPVAPDQDRFHAPPAP